jgi:AcrR family transcriptional regulator
MAIQRRGEDTRASILAAATACLAERGYDATSVGEICRRAGVSKGAFYHHFPSKHALFLELLNGWLAELDAQLEATRLQALSVPEGLLAMAEMFQQVFRQARGQLPVFLEFWTQSARDATVWEATIQPVSYTHLTLPTTPYV